MKDSIYNIDKKEDNNDLNIKDLIIILDEVAKLENNNNSKKVNLNERLLIRRLNNLISFKILRKSLLTLKIKLISLLFEIVKII